MGLHPHIVHVVGHTEAHHAATAQDVIEACGLARRAIENALGAPDLSADPLVESRREHLVQEAQVTLDAIRAAAAPDVLDPLADPATLAKAVTTGILDAPQLRSNPYARGSIRTRIIHGACEAVTENGRPLSEAERLKQ